ncbi:hypothetical protein ECPA4_1860, partial [Escherichia coli PA4]
WLTVTRTN